MSLYRRNKIWWVRFTDPHGRRIRKSTGIKDRVKAQEYHDAVKAEAWRVYKLGEKPRRTWQEAVARWCKETAECKASHRDDISILRWLDACLRTLYLDEITRDVVDAIMEAKLSEGVSNARVNRVMEVLRAILRRARNDWEWIDKIPKVRMLAEPKRRVRWITREEADCLINELPEHSADMTRFGLATGLRESNITQLEWSQLDLTRRLAWVHPDQAKSRKAIAVPLNRDAILVLRRQQGKHPLKVFTYKGQPVLRVNGKAWRAALKRAGITNFRFHDIRHTWASWHVQSGTPLHVLQELGGWESIEMVKRYAHLSADHLSEFADNIATPRAVHVAGTKLAQ